MFQHELYHSLVVQKEQSILEILNDSDLDEEAQMKEANIDDQEDKQEHGANAQPQRLSQGMTSLFGSLISFASDTNKSKAVNLEAIKLHDSSRFLSPFARKMRQNEVLLATQYRDQYVAFLKQLSLQICHSNRHFFFNSSKHDSPLSVFPLLQVAVKLYFQKAF